MNDIITTILLSLQFVGFMVSGILLWMRRLETGDYSRHIQAIFNFISAIFTFIFIFRTWAKSTIVDDVYLEPEHVFVPLLIQMAFFLYPLELIHPKANRTKVYTFLFMPLLTLFIIGMCTGIQYTTITTHAELIQHIAEPDVLFRLFTLTMMLFYSFSLFLVPYDWRKSNANRRFIRCYALGYCLIGIFHFAVHLSHFYIFQLLHQIMWMTFFFCVTNYDLRERLLLSKNTGKYPETKTPDFETMSLWERIVWMLDEEEKWRDPNLGLSSFSEELKSNRTYVGDAFKQNTGMTFSEYITKRRIDYVIEKMKQNPKADIHDLFSHVGYCQRTTAVRNFQKIAGMTPTEFLACIK